MLSKTVHYKSNSYNVLDWLRENQMEQNFEELPEEQLADILRQFFAQVFFCVV